jgi:exodeoxyribonuclease VII large subunit
MKGFPVALSETHKAAEALQEKIYTVTELNRRVRLALESEFSGLWMEGEISNFKFHSSGHMYLSLKDETSQISAVFFSRNNQHLKFEPRNGLKVIACGRLSLYEPRGQYQFYIERLEPKGLGALQLAFLQLKEKLEKDGLFLLEHKKPIPKYPQVVGVVTSPTGAAIRDILNVIGRRFHGTQVLLYPVRVQGDGAAQEIAQAIRDMNQMGEADVLIVGRGGGSIEDLWAFNEESVARAVFDSKIPIISAVGHEIDWTICDLVADLRAPTPSAAAELVVQNREAIEIWLLEGQQRMRKALLAYEDSFRQRLKALGGSYAFKQPRLLIDEFSQRLDEQMRQLVNYLKTCLKHKRQEFQVCVGRLNALSPLAILERGYSLTLDEQGEIIKESKRLREGAMIHTRLWHGRIHSKITKIQQEGE